jgi:hypothetical protein
VPLFDVVSTHCRLLISNSNEKKIHLKLWLMLTNPNKLNDIEQNNSNKTFVLLETSILELYCFHYRTCPMLLYDPISLLIFLLINLSARVQIGIYRKLINFLFNLVYSQNVLILMSRLDFEQKEKIFQVN